MARGSALAQWGRAWQRALGAVTRAQVKAGSQVAGRAVKAALKPALEHHRPLKGPGDWISGVAAAPGGMRRFHVYRPPGVGVSERLPLVVMLHGCQQDAKTFAETTRMNALAARHRFLVLYPEQDRNANSQGCWNWYETRSGQAQREAGILFSAVQQVCLLYPVDPGRVGVVGLSAGASMAALLATRHPERFKGVVMHSGVPPGVAHSTASALSAMRGRPVAQAPAPPPGPAAPAAGTSAWPPLLVIHGDNDRVVSASNAALSTALWATAAGASAKAPRRVQRGQRHAMRVTDYVVRGRTVATLCEVGDLGHAWSGGPARRAHSDARGPDASRLAWSFLSRHFSTAV